MGSRGQALKTGGFRERNYKTLIRSGNTRFVMQKDTEKSVKVPEMSNSPWAVYAIISKKGDLQTVAFFDGSRKRYKDIDFLRSHAKTTPHVHPIDINSMKMRDENNFRTLTSREKNYVKKIQDFFRRNNVKKLYEKEKSK